MPTNPYPTHFFARQDASDDRNFYTQPRLVVHIDEGAIAQLGEWLRELLPPNAAILDLMSSWRSHLPAELAPIRGSMGLGMNDEEMAENPQLDEHVVHSLNADPTLPFADEEFDAALCTVSVQYLTQPLAVFAEVNRVLKPGAPFVVSFSNRCFPTKAVAVWLSTDDAGHVELVRSYFANSASEYGRLGPRCRRANTRAESSWLGGGDPLYAVWAEKLPSGGTAEERG